MNDRLTISKAAEILGIKPTSLRRWIAKGALVRCDANPKRGSRAYYRRQDVEALLPLVGKWPYQIEAERWVAEGCRPCKSCAETKPFTEFHHHRGGVANRCSVCKLCAARRAAEDRRDPIKGAKMRAWYRRWEAQNRPKKRALNRKYYYRHIDARRASNREWRRANPQYRLARRAHATFQSRIRRVIWDGLTSPICGRIGFSIVYQADETFRAARLDRPLPREETALCRLEFLLGTWVVTAPPVIVGQYRSLSEEVTDHATGYISYLYHKGKLRLPSVSEKRSRPSPTQQSTQQSTQPRGGTKL